MSQINPLFVNIIGTFAPALVMQLPKRTPSQYVSDCCGVEMNGHDIDYEICPDCKEHCEVKDLEEEDEPDDEELRQRAGDLKFDAYRDGDTDRYGRPL